MTRLLASLAREYALPHREQHYNGKAIVDRRFEVCAAVAIVAPSASSELLCGPTASQRADELNAGAQPLRI
jgi:hypothetical protein